MSEYENEVRYRKSIWRYFYGVIHNQEAVAAILSFVQYIQNHTESDVDNSDLKIVEKSLAILWENMYYTYGGNDYLINELEQAESVESAIELLAAHWRPSNVNESTTFENDIKIYMTSYARPRYYQSEYLELQPLKIETRTEKAEPFNRFYNSIYYTDGYGLMNVAVGSPRAYGLSSLSNCVGLASGAFSETIYRYKKRLNPDEPIKQYYDFNTNAKGFIQRAKDLKLVTRLPSQRPPVGGIIVWHNSGFGHVAYIYDVINNNTISTHESAYKGVTWYTKKDLTRYTGGRGTNGTGKWGYSNCDYCLGYIVPPVAPPFVSSAEDEDMDSIVYIGNVPYVPHIYTNGVWKKAKVNIFTSGNWKKS